MKPIYKGLILVAAIVWFILFTFGVFDRCTTKQDKIEVIYNDEKLNVTLSDGVEAKLGNMEVPNDVIRAKIRERAAKLTAAEYKVKTYKAALMNPDNRMIELEIGEQSNPHFSYCGMPNKYTFCIFVKCISAVPLYFQSDSEIITIYPPHIEDGKIIHEEISYYVFSVNSAMLTLIEKDKS